MQHMPEIIYACKISYTFDLQVHQIMIEYSKKIKTKLLIFLKSINYSPKMADEKLLIII